MRCSKARELFFGNYDGLIDEAQKMKLQAHLDRCSECTSFVEEMESSLGMLKGLPDITPSENFGWNLKRRILQEKSHLMRRATGTYLHDTHWGVRFVASAAAVIVVALVGAWFLFGDNNAAAPDGFRIAGKTTAVRHQRDVSMPRFEHEDLTGTERPAMIRVVSNDAPGGVRESGSVGPQAFQDAALSREDSLLRENEYLKRYIQKIEHENMILKQYLYRARMRR
ncbi:MAG TPA: zf-HC2 domain-containing protein [Patescibacteria group bacterium]|nr:zf-HC2 domain-containing protein [Patescibacteria group bacterium]